MNRTIYRSLVLYMLRNHLLEVLSACSFTTANGIMISDVHVKTDLLDENNIKCSFLSLCLFHIERTCSKYALLVITGNYVSKYPSDGYFTDEKCKSHLKVDF
jgi:hypothetical protein